MTRLLLDATKLSCPKCNKTFMYGGDQSVSAQLTCPYECGGAILFVPEELSPQPVTLIALDDPNLPTRRLTDAALGAHGKKL